MTAIEKDMTFDLPSIIIETAALFIFYRVFFFSFLGRVLWKIYSTRSWWDYLTTYKGLITENTQIEMVYASLLANHHLIGGFLMLYSYYYDKPLLYAHAAMWELVDDINDMMCMIFCLWPFHERDIKMIITMGLHHLCGCIIVIPALTTGMYLDRNLQFIGLALLLAGGVSCTVLATSRTMDRRIPSEAWMDFFIWVINLSFFSVCRFYIFPQRLFLFFESSKIYGAQKYKLYAAVICMMLFNVLIWADTMGGTLTRLGVAINNGEKHAFDLACRCGACLRKRKHEHEE